MSRRLIIILGPTAVGKTDYSIETALRYGSPIISCDSRQIYKEMTIGTAVPSAEQLAAVQHYFIHSHTVTQLYTAGKYELEALEVINRLFDEGHDTLVMAGGSGFYQFKGFQFIFPGRIKLRDRMRMDKIMLNSGELLSRRHGCAYGHFLIYLTGVAGYHRGTIS